MLSLPGEIEVTRCTTCGFYKIGHSWRHLTMEELVFAVLEDFLEEDMEIEVGYEMVEGGIDCELTAEAVIGGERIMQTYETLLRFEDVECKWCSRYHSGYFTAVFQLRGACTREALETIQEFMRSKRKEEQRRSFIARIEKVKNGFDLYLSQKEMGEAFLKLLKKDYEIEEDRSSSLYGEKDGEKIYRETTLCRILGRK